MTTTTATATAVMNYGTMVVGERPRRSQEELVDRVMDALFASNHQQPQETEARRVHDARRLRKAGDLRRSAGGVRQRRTGHDCPKRGAMGLRRVAEPGAQDIRRPRSPGLQPGHRQSCGARSPRRRDRGSPGCAGDGVAAGQGGLREEPAGPEAPERRWVMVVANSAGGPGGAQVTSPAG